MPIKPQHENNPRALVVRGLFLLFLCAGVLIRISYLSELHEHPDFLIPMNYQPDMGFIDNSAMDMAQSARTALGLSPIEKQVERIIHWRQDYDTFGVRAPGYTFFLAVLYFLLGDNQVGIRIAQMILGIIGGILGYKTARRILGNRAGLVVFGLMMFHWPLVIYESALHEPALIIFAGILVINIAVYWAYGPTWRRAALLGLAASLFALSSNTIILFVPIVVAWMASIVIAKGKYKKAIQHTGIFLVCFLTPLISVSLAISMVSGRPDMFSSGAGITLYLGNQPESTGYVLSGDAILDRFLVGDELLLDTHEKAALVPWKEVFQQSYEEATQYILDHPRWFIGLTLKRAVLFWTPKEISQNIMEYCDRLFSRTLIWLPSTFMVVLTLFAMGLFFFVHDATVRLKRFLRHREDTVSRTEVLEFRCLLFVLLLVLFWYTPYCFFWVSAHFRAPLLPHLFLFGAFGLRQFFRYIHRRNWRALSWGLAGPVLVLPVMLLVPVSYDDDIERWLYFRTRYYLEHNQPERAVEIARRVVERAPDHAFARMTYGNTLIAVGDRPAALTQFEHAWARANDSVDVLAVAENVGILRREFGDVAGAAAAFQQVLAGNPEHYLALHGLGQFAFDRGEYARAIHFLERARAAAPEKANTYFLLGLSFNALGDPVRAQSSFREGLAADPNDIWITLSLADLLIDSGETDEACRLYEAAIALDPDNDRARRAFDSACLPDRAAPVLNDSTDQAVMPNQNE